MRDISPQPEYRCTRRWRTVTPTGWTTEGGDAPLPPRNALSPSETPIGTDAAIFPNRRLVVADSPSRGVPGGVPAKQRRWRWRNAEPGGRHGLQRSQAERTFPKTCSVSGREWLATQRRSVRCPGVRRSTCESEGGEA